MAWGYWVFFFFFSFCSEFPFKSILNSDLKGRVSNDKSWAYRRGRKEKLVTGVMQLPLCSYLGSWIDFFSLQLLQFRNAVIFCTAMLSWNRRGDSCIMSPISSLVSYIWSVPHIIPSVSISYSVLHHLGPSCHDLVQMILSQETSRVDTALWPPVDDGI